MGPHPALRSGSTLHPAPRIFGWGYHFLRELCPKTDWWISQTAKPFAKVIGDIPPNRTGQQFHKLTFSPSRAAAAAVSYDFRHPDRNARSARKQLFLLHVFQKSCFLFCLGFRHFVQESASNACCPAWRSASLDFPCAAMPFA